MSLTSGDQLGPYRIVALIGKGGMGEVYRATDTRLNRDVALKVSAKAFDERFAREARAIASLNHPNICTLYDVGPNYLVMELVEGEHPKGPLPTEEALNIANQIAAALEAAHEKGIVHRDLKPGNVLIKPDGTVKVLDFGLAKMNVREQASGEDSPTISIAATDAGMILGTAAYMAPEQAKGKPVDGRADIWAFGVVLYELTTGRRLFQGEDVTEIMASVVKENPDLSAAPQRLRRLLDACLQKDPRKRLQSIADMRLLIQDEAPAPGPARSVGRWAAIGAVVGAALALTAMHFRDAPIASRSLRLQLDLPGQRVPYAMEISPDGRRLVISLQKDGVTQLYVRSLESEELQPLSGTNNAWTPFWSPDSRMIGFFADGALKVISAAGGPVQQLCNESNLGDGGTWNSDSIILFADRAANGAFRRVSAKGGPCETVGKESPGTQTFAPAFLPDGTHFLYVRITQGDAAANGIYLAALDEPVGRKIIADVSSAIYTPPVRASEPAHLLFLRDTTLMAQPFDGRSLQAVGDPRPIASRATYAAAQPRMAASASAEGTLVYTAGASRPGQLTWIDRSGNRLGTIGSPAWQSAVALSPDGKMVATSHFQAAATPLWIYDLARETENRLIPRGRLDEIASVWSPGSEKIWFHMAGPHGNGLYRQDTQNGALEFLQPADPNAMILATDLSRDGRYFVFSSLNTKTKSDIWYAPLQSGRPGGKPVMLLGTNAVESQGKLSPDGNWIAYYSDEAGKGHVYVRAFPAGSEVWKVSAESAREPRWSADGRELYFLQMPGTLMAAAVGPGAAGQLRVGKPRPLFQMNSHTMVPHASAWSYSPHPDGRRFIAILRAEDESLTVNVVTNWQKALTQPLVNR